MMERLAAMYVCPETKKGEAKAILQNAVLSDLQNASAWWVNGFLYLYMEGIGEKAQAATADLSQAMNALLQPVAEFGTMRLMYHCIGIVREDKDLIRHRVFATQLKPDCAEEYFNRHDVLVKARGDAVIEGPESNFTIWCANSKYIFGYCELVKSFDHEMTEEEKASTIAWETRQLEIMDWFTDDVDWITKEKHPKMECLWQQ